MEIQLLMCAQKYDHQGATRPAGHVRNHKNMTGVSLADDAAHKHNLNMIVAETISANVPGLEICQPSTGVMVRQTT